MKQRIDIVDHELRSWVEHHTEDWTRLHWDSVTDYDESAWRTYRTILSRFGTLWPTLNNVAGTVIVQRYLCALPKRRRNGVEYSQPYSLELHLAALSHATSLEDVYGEAEVIA